MAYIFFAVFFLILIIGLFIGGSRLKKQAKEIKVDEGSNRYDARHKKELTTWALGLKIGGFVALFIFVLFTIMKSIVVIDVGHSAVTTFTGDTRDSLGNGMHFVAPWYDVVDYETRTQEYTMSGDGSGEGIEAGSINAPTKDGSNVGVDLTVRYQINSSAVADIYEQYGSGDAFQEKVIYNDLRAVARDVIVRYDALEARGSREAIGPEIQNILQERWGEFARVELVNVRDLRLAPEVQEAANNVLRAQEEARARLFVLDQERTNSNIARIQAQGVADSQQIIICGGTVTVDQETGEETVIPNEGDQCQDQLSQELLTWKYIETLESIGAAGNLIIVPSDGTTDLILPTPQPTP